MTDMSPGDTPESLALKKLALLGKPPRLPLNIPARIAWGSIRIRLSRSLVTVSSVILAVAFLLVVIGGNIANHAVYRSYDQDRQPIERVRTAYAVLERPRDPLMLLSVWSRDPAAMQDWASNYDQTLPDVPIEAMTTALDLASWVDRLRPIQRYLLLGNLDTSTWLFALDDSAAIDALFERLRAQRSDRLPVPPSRLQTMAMAMSAIANGVQSLHRADVLRLQSVQAAGGAAGVLAALRQDADRERLTALGLPLDQIMPDIDEDGLAAVRQELEFSPLRYRAQRILAQVNRTFSQQRPLNIDDLLNENVLETGRQYAHGLRNQIGPRLDETLALMAEQSRIDPLEEALQDDDDPERESQRLRTSEGARAMLLAHLVAKIDSEERAHLAAGLAQHRAINTLRERFLALDFDPLADDSRTTWLVVLSLLVCVVGIVNSMMMAVTERFLEIATMKCLGAMDSFILKSFMIESGIVGSVGSLLGAVLGLAVVLMQAASRFGEAFWEAFPLKELGLAVLATLVMGLILTVIGALLPAYKAARMHPIDAMRLEA